MINCTITSHITGQLGPTLGRMLVTIFKANNMNKFHDHSNYGRVELWGQAFKLCSGPIQNH